MVLTHFSYDVLLAVGSLCMVFGSRLENVDRRKWIRLAWWELTLLEYRIKRQPLDL